MINKQNVWFITLFSLIMVLSIYYLTMANDSLTDLSVKSVEETTSVTSDNVTLVALKVANEEALVSKITELQNILLSDTASLEEKSKAYDELQAINKNESKKEEIEKLLKDSYSLDSVVTIDGNNIKVNIASTTHDGVLANNIIRSIQSLYTETMYITIKFGN